ncbi:hypothetical protein L2E82_01444 [Cichorium intybus]|uniref:Uncharacterized protein n=1 Tax=Cichorium intybus TaxID=13427 RepID=A0ACB9H016_CICIN|nr:hypothetical protein L2E82_01444 [Cichorium intybus]
MAMIFWCGLRAMIFWCGLYGYDILVRPSGYDILVRPSGYDILVRPSGYDKLVRPPGYDLYIEDVLEAMLGIDDLMSCWNISSTILDEILETAIADSKYVLDIEHLEKLPGFLPDRREKFMIKLIFGSRFWYTGSVLICICRDGRVGKQLEEIPEVGSLMTIENECKAYCYKDHKSLKCLIDQKAVEYEIAKIDGLLRDFRYEILYHLEKDRCGYRCLELERVSFERYNHMPTGGALKEQKPGNLEGLKHGIGIKAWNCAQIAAGQETCVGARRGMGQNGCGARKARNNRNVNAASIQVETGLGDENDNLKLW